ncbi:MAG: hypothetical protein RLZZ164_1006 [Actinomycetota bacterium]|jgi:ATP-binding cassette subfamily C protein CydC
MKRLISLGLPVGSKFYLGVFVAVLQGLSAIALLATSAWLIARAAEMPAMMYLSLAVVGVRTFALARAALRYAERMLTHDSVLGSQTDLRANLYRRLTPLVPSARRVNLGELSSRVVQDVDELPNFALRVFLPLVQAIAVSVLSVLLFAFVLPSFALVLAVALVFAFVLALPVAGLIANAVDRSSAKDREELVVRTSAAVSSAALIGAYGWSQQQLGSIAQTQERIGRGALKAAKAFGLGQAAFGFMAQTSAILAAVVGLAHLEQIGSKSLVMLAVYALLPLGIFDVASGASAVTSAWRRYRASATRVLELLDLPEYRVAVSKFEPIKALELRAATLSYAGYEAQAILEGVNLKLPRGKVVALTGPSGSGKSTIGLALAGLVDVSSGGLLVNGRSAPNGETLRTRVGYLEQSPAILSGNVRQNLKLAKPDASDSELVDVLNRVKLWSMFQLRDGLDTQLGERGVLISGGEAQRLSLARALLADFDVIVLDEPTANLSASQAKELLTDLLATSRSKNRAVLLITHEAKLAKLADERYTLD